MFKRKLPLAWRLLVLLACFSTVRALEEPANLSPEICDLVVKSDSRSSNAVITWSGGTPPFSVVRGDAARFDQATEVMHLSETVSKRRYVDLGALRSGRRYYYQVYDLNSAPEVFSIRSDQEPEGSGPASRNDDPAPDSNYCRGSLRKPATWD